MLDHNFGPKSASFSIAALRLPDLAGPFHSRLHFWQHSAHENS